ncbi:hypothetical protein [Rickettsia endosymbiont of Urophora cardui]|uniref:hypothetical protein n=1 Tax=Rickettsia endosymbiont of Urophora cardui TaxID=3066265 RepID=UPI00313F2FB7
MFKITNITKQLINVARNIPKAVSASINSSSQSKGYIENASNEFTFLKALPSQSVNVTIQDKFKAFTPNLANITKVKPTQLLDPADIRKLIYARFAEEIGAGHKNDEEKKNLDTKNLETKSHVAREHAEACSTYSITEEFEMFKAQGYDFAAAKKAVQNQSSKSIFKRMQELSISGYLSNYAGNPSLREDIEKVIIQKELVINEFMATVAGKVEELEEYSTELLG